MASNFQMRLGLDGIVRSPMNVVGVLFVHVIGVAVIIGGISFTPSDKYSEDITRKNESESRFRLAHERSI